MSGKTGNHQIGFFQEYSMSTNWSKDINKMHKHYGVSQIIKTMSPEKLKKFLEFRIDFIREELDELVTAETAEDAVDALIDLCVVVIGTLDAFDVDANKAWNEVLIANMNKKTGVNTSRPNPMGLPDLIKPEGWQAPSHESNHGLLTKVF
jgi:hypothetical protein